MSSDSPLAWVAIDFLSCLLLVVYTLIAPPPKPATIDTLGQYAVEVTWPLGRSDDVDTYVEDPAGNVAWYEHSDVGLMHLEHDDRGVSSDRQRQGAKVVRVRDNRERVVLRGVLPGEVTVNLHAYQKTDTAPCPVSVKLHRLRGDDRMLLERSVNLTHPGQEVTVFRFTLDASGSVLEHNRLTKSLVGALWSPTA
jgi:hypothetical protein